MAGTLETLTGIAQVRPRGDQMGWDKAGREYGLLGVPCFAPKVTADNPFLLVGGHSSQVPLMRDVDGSVSSGKSPLF